MVAKRFVQQIYATDKVRLVVVMTDEVRKAFGRVGRKVVNDFELATSPQLGDEVDIPQVAFQKLNTLGQILAKSTRKVIGASDLHAEAQAMFGHVGADETGCAGH